MSDRFCEVFIGSGDGIFAATAARLVEQGCKVVVVGRRGSISRRLAMASHEVRYLDELTPSAPLWAA